MRAGVERLARRWWARELGWRGVALDAVTAPLAWGWAAAVEARDRSWQSRAPTRVDGIHVVSVGNLAVGGTGKTPVAAWVADRLDEQGLCPAIVVGAAAPDEAELHRRWRPARLVLVDRDRRGATERAKAEGARAVVLDDAFQHRALARDVDLVLVSADDPFPGPLLPRGPYREPVAALARADAIVVTRREADGAAMRAVAEVADPTSGGRVVAGASLVPMGWRRLGDSTLVPLGDGPSRVLAACSVARADAFRRAVAKATGRADVDVVAFADHHAYRATDVMRMRGRAGGRAIATTEKDAVKLERWSEQVGEAWVLIEEVRWEWGEAELVARLARR